MPQTARSIGLKVSDSTREKILDAAEQLFVEKGFNATSVRAIANLAAVNLAATNYHFGSKQKLLAATIHRRAEAVNEARLARLAELELSTHQPAVGDIVGAFFAPISSIEHTETLPQLIARVYGEPRSISRPLLEQEFGVVIDRYVAALTRAMPHVEEEEVHWRFHFLIGAMVHMLNFPAPSGRTSDEPKEKIIRRTVAFVTAGLLQIPFAAEGVS